MRASRSLVSLPLRARCRSRGGGLQRLHIQFAAEQMRVAIFALTAGARQLRGQATLDQPIQVMAHVVGVVETRQPLATCVQFAQRLRAA